MSRRDHDLIEELLAVRALGGLDGDDLQTLARELASYGDCDECRRLELESEETAGRLGFALDPAPVGADAADAILRRTAEPDVAHPAPMRHRRIWQAWGAVAAVVVAAVVAAVALPHPRTDVHASADQTVVHFTGSGGELAMGYSPRGTGAVFVGSGFSDPGPGKVYEIWMIQGKTAVRGGCVEPHDGSIATFVDANLRGVDLMAVTVESSACPNQPTTTPFLTAPLTA
ncbi:MAG: anti-sigma factor domain-containing protein [Actinomycetota bacterium]